MYLQYVGSCTDTGICIIAVLLRVLVEHVCRSFRVYLYIIRDTLNPTLSISNNKSKKVTTCCPVSQVLQKKKTPHTVFWSLCCHCTIYYSNSVWFANVRWYNSTTQRNLFWAMIKGFQTMFAWISILFRLLLDIPNIIKMR